MSQDREKYTLKCLTAPNRTTGRKKKYSVSPSKEKQEQETGACKSSVPCSFLQLLHWKYVFQMLRTPVCRFTCNAWFTCNKFSHADTSALLHSHTHFFSVFGVLMLRWMLTGLSGHFVFWLKHGNHPIKTPVTVFGKFGLQFRSCRAQMCVCVCTVWAGVSVRCGYQPNVRQALIELEHYVFSVILYSFSNLCTSTLCVITAFGLEQTFLREK